MNSRKKYRNIAKDCKIRFKQLVAVHNYNNSQISLFEQSVYKLIDERVVRELGNIPVEALNFNSARIRTSSLRAAGYNNIGQLVGKSSFSLRNIYGIGEASVERIRQNASAFYKHFYENIKIKSNIRSQSDKDRDVVIRVGRYLLALDVKQKCYDFAKRYRADCYLRVKRLLRNTSGIVWVFTSKDKKNKKLEVAKDTVEKRCIPFLDDTKDIIKIRYSDNEVYSLYKNKIEQLNECVSKKWPCIEFVNETVERMITPANVKTGYNVTGICKVTPQPRGGYLNISIFNKEIFSDEQELSIEQLSPGIIGTTVDYLTRMQLGCDDKRKAFEISLLGAGLMGDDKIAEQLIEGISDLSDESIRNAALLVGYDATYRAGYPYHVDLNYQIDPNSINNIRILVNRSVNFFKENGEQIESGLVFVGGYTERVSSGDADYMVGDTIWDLKTSKTEPDKNQTLQIMIYYLLAKHSGQEKYKQLKNIGIYNPRLNTSYKLNIEKIDKTIVEAIEKDVIGY